LRWTVFGGTGALGTALRDAYPLMVDSSLGSADLDLACADGVTVDSFFDGLRPGSGALLLAAMTAVGECERRPHLARLMNATVPMHVARAAYRRSMPLVLVSTDYVFGGTPGPHLLRHEPAPTCAYGETKARGEALLRAFHPRSAVVRMSFLPDPPGYAWVAEGVRCTKEWVDAAALRLAAFLRSPEALRPGTHHLTTSRETTLADLVRERHPWVPGIPLEEARSRAGYRIPRDVRLSDPWRGGGEWT
jgi:dTDP-4-dehydrorhamnose reductase